MSNVFSSVLTLGRDAEVRYTTGGTAVLNATGACNIGYGERQQTLWIVCSLFGKRAEGELVNYCKKGQKIFVSGELTMREYDAKDGTRKTVLDLNCSVLELCGSKQSDEPKPAQAARPSQPTGSYQDDYDPDIPF